MPGGSRKSAPVRTGVEVTRPNSRASRPSSRLIGIPITPNISQTAKHTVNANVLTPSTRRDFVSAVVAIKYLSQRAGGRPDSRKRDAKLRCGQLFQALTQINW